ncbi:MAG: MFS transporter [Acidobacteriota bacterium]
MDNLVQPMTIAALLVTGMGVALLGSIKLPLARKLEIGEARVGGLVSAFGFTIIPMILISGFLTDHFGEQAVLVAGSALMAVSMLFLGGSRGFPSALVAILLLGSAWSALANAVNVFVPAAFGGSLAYATNFANFFFGLGAFLTPMGLAALLRKREIPAVLYGLGAAVVIPGVLALMVDFSTLLSPDVLGLPPEEVSGSGTMALLSSPVLWLCSMGFFFYAPLEAAMGAWTTTYLGGRGVTEASALRWLSGFWLAFMLSRLITAFSLSEGAEAGLILTLSVVCIVVLASVVLSSSLPTAVITVIAAGLVFGPIFPTILALLLGEFPLEVRGRAVGLFFAIGAIGWTITPALIGSYARRTTLQQGFIFGVASAIGLTLVAVGLAVRFGLW